MKTQAIISVQSSISNLQSPHKVQAAVSSLVSALAFLDVFQSASETGKARLLDGSTQHGPSAWHVRMPQVREVPLFRAGD